jgi:tRNA 5-methylaminomethyl-2-thiouridine biosynthesis bifunctional protein
VSAPLVPARLAFHDGVPYSEAYADVYHSAAGGPAQAVHVFLHGNGLPGRWAGRGRFVVLETGFGGGLNFLVTWRAWRRDPARCARLHFVSVEKHPFTRADLQLFLRSYPELRAEATELEARWPMLVPGVHRIELDAGNVILTLFFADVARLREARLAADAFYLDGFAPARNPEMWSPQVLRMLARLAAPGASAATWSVASGLRHALEETGFAVEKRPGFGDKREMLVARYERLGREVSSSKHRLAHVVGAGLAGAAVCERLCARGWHVTLHERHAAPAEEASGNHAGAFHPIVTPDDSVFARLTRAGFLHSIAHWKRFAELRWDRCGVLQLARDAREEASQRRAVAAIGLPPEYARAVTREEAGEHAGVPLTAGGLWFAEGGWVQPRSLVEAQLAACGTRLERRFGQAVTSLPRDALVVLANGAEAPRLHPVAHLRLRQVRGQLTYLPAGALEAPRVVVLRGGMVLPPVQGMCVIGASFDLNDDDPALRRESHEGNLARLENILGVRVAARDIDGRVGFRAVAPDRLPVAGRLDEGVYAAFAYGSRGLVWAALAAERIAAELEGEPLPLEGALVDALSPQRFALRANARARSPGLPRARRAGRTTPS